MVRPCSDRFCYGKAVPDIPHTALGRFKRVLLKRGSVALGLWGEAGLGKTYQARELLRNVPCQTLSLHATTSWANLAHSLPEAKKLPVWAERTLARLRGGENVETKQSLDALTAFLTTFAPVIVHIEDLHEADHERLASIQALARQIQRSKGVGLVVTSRSEPPDPFEKLRLEPLSKKQSDTLLESEVSATLPKEALEFIYSKAVGNPLYTLEYLRFLSRQGFLWNDGKRWHWRKPEKNVMPITVEVLIELALSTIQEEKLTTVLQSKAFLPLDASDDLWQKVTGLSEGELEAAKLDLERRGIFSNGSFVHPLYREVVFQALATPRRQQFARRALEVLHDNPIQAVPFLEEAGLEPPQLLDYLERAASKARELGNAAEAARFQARLLPYKQGNEQELAILALETAFDLYAYDLSGAIRLLEQAQLTNPHNVDVLERLVIYLAQAGQRAKVESLLEGLSSSQGSSPRVTMITIAAHHYLQDSKRVAELWDTHPELHATASATTIRNVAFSKADLGDVEAALGLANRALNKDHLSVEERALLLETCGFACYARSAFAAAVPYYTQAIALFRESGQAHRTGSLFFNRAITYQSLAQFSESLADAEAARQLAVDHGHALFYANAQLALAMANVERADYELAEERFLECERYYQQTGMTGWLVDTHLGISELYREWQTPYGGVLARKHAAKALALAKPMNNPRYVAGVMPYVVMAEALFGEAHRALELADEGTCLCKGDAVLLSKMMRARATALHVLGRSNEARGELEKALTIAQAMNIQLEVAKLGLELAHLNHDVEGARKHLNWFEERGLLNSVRVAKRYFPELAEQAVPTASPKNVPRLNVLGVMQFQFEGKTTNVRGRKRQELFALLLEAQLSGRAEVSRLDLFDALYPHSNEAQALGNLKQLIHSSRLELGESVIKTTANGYALGEITSDAETFLQTGDTTLWQGRYLQGLEMETRENVAESLYLLLFDKAKTLLELDSKGAVRVAKFLLEYDPYRADYLALSLQALRKSDNHRTLARIYEQAKTHFAEVGETLPPTWTEFLEHQLEM
jgi:tetratricopeptide (TPR) repeat protein